MANPLDEKEKKRSRVLGCGEKEIGMARSNGGQVVSGFWVVLTPAVDIGAKDFSFFGGEGEEDNQNRTC